MLFLLNTVVVRTQFTLELPTGLESLTRLAPRAVLKAGGELYQKHPRLEHERPDIARWYCTLLQLKIPDASAAIFVRTTKGGYEGKVADVPVTELARWVSLQDAGVDITPEIRRMVWAAVTA